MLGDRAGAMTAIPYTSLACEWVCRCWPRPVRAFAGVTLAYRGVSRADYDTGGWRTGRWTALLMYLPGTVVVFARSGGTNLVIYSYRTYLAAPAEEAS